MFTLLEICNPPPPEKFLFIPSTQPRLKALADAQMSIDESKFENISMKKVFGNRQRSRVVYIDHYSFFCRFFGRFYFRFCLIFNLF